MQQKTGNATAKAVLLVLAEAADSRGVCRLGQARIASVVEVTDRAVRGALSVLLQAGIIESEARMRKNGRGRGSNTYRLLMARDQPEAGSAKSGNQPEGRSGKSDQPEGRSGKSHDQPEAGSGAHTTYAEPIEDNPPVVPPTDSNGDKRPRRSRRCPEWWEPNDGHRSLAAELGVDFGLEIAKLRDHEFDKPRSDWDATARNWLRKAAQMNPQRGGGGANLMLATYDPSRAPAPHPKPVKTRMQVEHEARMRRAAGL